jgi:hypothetical protein
VPAAEVSLKLRNHEVGAAMWVPREIIACLLTRKPCQVNSLPGLEMKDGKTFEPSLIEVEELRPRYPNSYKSGISGAGLFALGLLIDLF